MLWLALLAVVGPSQTATSVTTLNRVVTVSVFTKKLVPVGDLKAEEVRILEDGKERKVLGVELDRRPLDVAIVVDSGGTVAAAYRSDLVPAVVDFWKALPPETKVALWSTAPAKILEFGGDLSGGETKLRMIAAAGGNYGFDSMVDAAHELGKRGAPRRVIVYVGSGSLQASIAGTSALARALGETLVTPMAVLVLPSARGSFGGGPSGDAVQAFDVQGYFAQVARAYHGAYVEALSTLAVAQWLRQFAADINGQYSVRYESVAGREGEVKVEVRRKDARSRVGRSVAEISTVQ
jgi:hypothetical protein